MINLSGSVSHITRISRHRSLIKSWILSRRHNVKILEILQKVHEMPADVKARQFINNIQTLKNHRRVYLVGATMPLYIPLELTYPHLLDIIYEILVPNNWHHYESHGTPVDEKDIVVDCGASEGLFSFMHRGCRKVYAVEPLPLFAASLKKTFTGMPNITVVPAALSDNIGIGYLEEKSIGSRLCHDTHKTKVIMSTIDDMFFKKNIRVSYLKADVEGHEYPLIKGATQTLIQFQPKIAVAVYHKKGNARRVASFIRRVNPSYEIETVGLHPHTGEPMMVHARVR